MALKGEYDFLDGLVIFNSCDTYAAFMITGYAR